MDQQDERDEHDDDLDDVPGTGRIATTIGGLLLIVGLFMTWYQVVRRNGYTTDTSGWQTFTNLRFVVLAAGFLALVSTLLRHDRRLAIGRVLVGVALAVLVVRRIASPPELTRTTVNVQLGIYVSLLGALGIALGGLLGLGSSGDEGGEQETGSLAERRPAAELGSGEDEQVVDAEVV